MKHDHAAVNAVPSMQISDESAGNNFAAASNGRFSRAREDPFRQRCHPERYEERSESLADLLLVNFIALLSHWRV